MTPTSSTFYNYFQASLEHLAVKTSNHRLPPLPMHIPGLWEHDHSFLITVAGKITIIALIGSLWAFGEVGSSHRNTRNCGCRMWVGEKGGGGGVCPGMETWDIVTWEKNTCRIYYCKGVYLQSDRSLAIVDIDASKGFIALWVHLSVAIFAIFDVKRQIKLFSY